MIDKNAEQFKTTEIHIGSKHFEVMLQKLDAAIKDMLGEVVKENFDGGSITLKLDIEIPEAYSEIPCLEDGEIVQKPYYYKTPRFKYGIASNLKRVMKDEGRYNENKEIEERDGAFFTKPLPQSQMAMHDYIDISEEVGNE